MFDLMLGDCLDRMHEIEDKSVDMILADLPYGTTEFKWDSIIPFGPLWEHYLRIIKEKKAIVLFSTMPFTSILGTSQIDKLKYSFVWKYNKPSGFFLGKVKPLKQHEDILVFSSGSTCPGSKNNMPYNPQGLIVVDKKQKGRKEGKYSKNGFRISRPSISKDYIQQYSNYPRSILEFNKEKTQIHPSQKPVELIEYLIKTYTSEKDIILDNVMGSGSTGIACLNTNRKFIGIEKDEKYFSIAKQRIEKHYGHMYHIT